MSSSSSRELPELSALGDKDLVGVPITRFPGLTTGGRYGERGIPLDPTPLERLCLYSLCGAFRARLETLMAFLSGLWTPWVEPRGYPGIRKEDRAKASWRGYVCLGRRVFPGPYGFRYMHLNWSLRLSIRSTGETPLSGTISLWSGRAFPVPPRFPVGANSPFRTGSQKCFYYHRS